MDLAATNVNGFVFYLFHFKKREAELSSCIHFAKATERQIKNQTKTNGIYCEFNMQFSIHFALNSLLNLIFDAYTHVSTKELVYSGVRTDLCVRSALFLLLMNASEFVSFIMENKIM